MLSKIIIKDLFHLYDYDIDLTNADGGLVKFITAPNGYGKTTILNFINDIMTEDYSSLFVTPFDEFSMIYGEANSNSHNVISIRKEIIPDEPKDDSDEIAIKSTKLQISLKKINGEEEATVEKFSLAKNVDSSITKKGNSDNINMFFASRTCHYITDSRLMRVKTDGSSGSTHLDKVELRKYANLLKGILSNPEERKIYERRIQAFQMVIDRCDYAQKRMEVDERFGFRFVANDELETKLSLESLSSGEKHMLIQTFEILFVAQEGTLVLIDEPELSLHMMWQMNYLKNLEEILKIRQFQCIIATHSPQIFNSIWSKSVDLYKLSKAK